MTLAIGELDERGGLDAVTGELIAAGRQTAADVGVVLLGGGEDAARRALALGASASYLVRHEALERGGADASVAALADVCAQLAPKIALFGRTEFGSEVGPRLAFRLGVGLAQDCARVGVDAASGRMLATRPVYGGNAMATVTFPGDGLQIAIMRGRAYEPLPPSDDADGEIVNLVVKLDGAAPRVRRIREVSQPSEETRLEDAEVVVAGGRGLGGPEPFAQLRELAQMLGGAMGASRAACDAGWVDHSYQVGLTGRTIAPRLYLTVGISGASQHMAGCSGSKSIVAINKDRESNIFKEASYGVVADWREALPSFMAAARELIES